MKELCSKILVVYTISWTILDLKIQLYKINQNSKFLYLFHE